jgi:predicted nuclease of predicted toxin-antitoxin system
VKLLFDHNVSPRVPARLANIFPSAGHVALLGLDRASDDRATNRDHAHDATAEVIWTEQALDDLDSE